MTGGIGTGKSTVSKILAELGAMVIDADRLGHEVFKPGTKVWKQVVDAFRTRITGESGEIDRKKLSDSVFKNHEALSRLNSIMHPAILQAVKERLEEIRCCGAEVVLIEATLLIEASWDTFVDEIWVTTSSRPSVMSRLRTRGLSDAELMARILSQMSQEEYIKHADVVIRNDGSLAELRIQVEEKWLKAQRKWSLLKPEQR